MAKKLSLRRTGFVGKDRNLIFQRLYTVFITLLLLFFFSETKAGTISCPGNKEIDQLIDKGISLNNEGENKEALKLFQKANCKLP
ncbi:hypothetical protein [Chryseobacterium vaccae]|uniref:hypothetical protein n=1 Tax=Chryseobacterium vaccae TaxID=2604424 RepID=UPI00129535D0|nr:hypothetical protein [Chryseobacterium vaccae]